MSQLVAWIEELMSIISDFLTKIGILEFVFTQFGDKIDGENGGTADTEETA